MLDGKSISDYLATNGAGTRQIAVVPDDFRFPYQRTATAGLGWQLTSTTRLDVDYVHAYSVGQGAQDANLPASGAITAANPRPIATLGRVSLVGLPITKGWYDAMEMQVRQRVRGGTSLQVSYTLSRSLIDGCFSGNCAGTLRAFARESLAALSSTGQSLEYGYNSQDTRHNLSVSVSFTLPAGIQLSGIGRIISASPIGITCGCDLDGDGVNDRPRGTPPTIGRGDLDAQLAAINAYRATLNLAPFTLDRIKVLPAAKNIDIRLTKQLTLGRSQRLEVFAEAFNITNAVNTHTPGTDVRLDSFNVPTGAQDARQIQWGGRYSF